MIWVNSGGTAVYMLRGEINRFIIEPFFLEL